jgi:di/tricarboxylate transporter
MNRLVQTTLTIIWGLWLGGLVVLLIAVSTLFRTFPLRHDIAGEAASAIFHQFNEYRLGLAAAGLLLTGAWWLRERSRGKMALFVLLALAAVAAFVSSAVLTPKIDHLRLAQLTHTAEFARLHGLSMGIYLIETILVFAAGIVLPNSYNRSAV